MYLTYQGPYLEVEVPVDASTSIFVEQGKAADFPDDLAEGLLDQGRDSSEENPQHNPQWVKATAKQVAEAKKAADQADDSTASEAEKGDDA